jgi:hypothetical protein
MEIAEESSHEALPAEVVTIRSSSVAAHHLCLRFSMRWRQAAHQRSFEQ